MPKGYAIFTVTIRDQAGYDVYIDKALPTIVESGGRPIVMYDDPEVLEGQSRGSRIVMLEFDSVQAARNWYSSPAYQAVIGERHASTTADAVIVGGLEMPSA